MTIHRTGPLDRDPRRGFGRRRLLGAAGAGTAALVAAACGSDEPEQAASTLAGAGSSAGTTTAGSAATAAATPQAKRGGTLPHSTITVIPNLDVHSVATQNLQSLGPGIAYSRLLYLDVSKDGLPALNAIPRADLAERWEQVDDLTYVFQLRRGVKYFNLPPVNGREWNAEDVVYSFVRQRELKANTTFLDPVDRYEAVDPYTLRLRLSRPDTDLLVNITEPHNKVDVPREQVEAKGDIKEPPVIGTGAYMFDEKAWVRGSFMRFTRNPNYYNRERPYFENIDQYVITDRSTFLAALRTKKVLTTALTASNNLTRQEANQLKRELPDFVVLERPSFVAEQFHAHTQKPPTNDPRVRQALSKLIDRQLFNQTVRDGDGWWTVGIKVPGRDALLPEDEVKRLLARDVQGARQLLQAAGVSNWSPRMTAQTTATETAEFIQAQLKEVGINPQIRLVSTQEYTEVVRGQGNFEIHVGSDQLGASTNQDLQVRYATGGSLNGPRLSDPDLDRLIQQQAAERDPRKRVDLLKQVQRRIVDLAALIPVVGLVRLMGNWREVRDFEPTFGTDFYEYWNVQTGWLDH